MKQDVPMLSIVAFALVLITGAIFCFSKAAYLCGYRDGRIDAATTAPYGWTEPR